MIARYKIQGLIGITLSVLCLYGPGCQPSHYRKQKDDTAAKIISQKQLEALGRTEPFSINRPSSIFRRRLLEDQNLPHFGPASLGSDQLEPIPHWPKDDYLKEQQALTTDEKLDPNTPVKLTLLQSLEVGARNSFDYQTRKEEVFRSALSLDLERNEFRTIFNGQMNSLINSDTRGPDTVTGTVNSADVGVNKKLENGMDLSSALAVDLARLLTMNQASSLGLVADASVSVPLLRGSGKHIVTEPLTQAERNVVYAIWEFERFKKQFAVQVASNYLSVLSQLDTLKNNQDDYRSRIASARRSRRLADAGRIQEIEVDQAVQNELQARRRWISAEQQYQRQLDSFKTLLGLPADAKINLDPNDLKVLTAPSSELIQKIAQREEIRYDSQTPPADAPINLVPPTHEGAGPLELEEETALQLAFDHRLDLWVAQGRMFDAQRAVVVAADALGAELTLFGSANWGDSRSSVGSAVQEDAKLRLDEGTYSALLTLDLPFERTREAINYRNSYIQLESSLRDVQALEDDIKLQIRNELRDMLELRENLAIQSQSVFVAEKRVKSVNLFLDAGRAQMRDLLDAQDALLAAQISLTSAVVDYRVAELQIQRDMGVLQVNENGLWQEYAPEMVNDVKK
jgi:outer membrane protein TolC